MEKAVLNRALRRFSSPLLNEKPLPKDIQVEVDSIKKLIISILAMSDGIVSQLMWYTDESEVALMADDTACMLQDFVMQQQSAATISRVKSFFYSYNVFLRLKRLRLHLSKIKDELDLSEKSSVGIVKTKQVHANNVGIEEGLKRQEGVTPCNSAENCIRMLMCEALVDPTKENFQSLLVIGKEIVQQCDYSPKMIKIVGEMLRFRPEQNYWQAVLDSTVLSNRSDFSLLATSCKVLPWQVKAFHAYDLLFPDKGIFKEHLVDLWIAEGIVSTSAEIEKYFFGLKENECYCKL